MRREDLAEAMSKLLATLLKVANQARIFSLAPRTTLAYWGPSSKTVQLPALVPATPKTACA